MLLQRLILSFLLLISQCSAFVLIPTLSTRTTTRTTTTTATAQLVRLASHNDSKEAATQTTRTSTASISSNNNDILPANLRRKIRAPRPAIGHVVGKNGVRCPPLDPATSATRKATGGSAQDPLPLYKQGKLKNSNNRRNSPAQRDNNNSNNVSHRQSHRLLQIVAGTAKGRKLDSPSVYLRPMMAKVREAVFSTLSSFGLYKTTRISSLSSTSSSSSSSSSTLRHLDLFAGSGSVGLESLSRGAGHVTFVDLSPNCCDTIRRNAMHCQFLNPDRVSILCADAIKVLKNDPQQQQEPSSSSTLPYNLVTICPPYEEVVYADLLEAVVSSPLVTEDTVVLVEYPVELGSLPHVISSSSSLVASSASVSVSSASSSSSATSTSSALALPRRTMVGVRNRKYGRTVIAMYVVNPSGGAAANSHGGSFRLDPDAAASRPEEFV